MSPIASLFGKTPSVWVRRAAWLITAGWLIGCAGYVPGQKAYWDEKVRELCAKDGGVQIFERWRPSKEELEHLDVRGGVVSVPIKSLADPESPVYALMTKEIIRPSNPEVHRSEVIIVRRKDKVTLAKSVVYGRVGGDFPSYAHRSSFGCPDPQTTTSDLQQVFLIERDGR